MDERQEIFLEEYPVVRTRFDELCVARQDEILEELLTRDEHYKLLTQRRVTASQELFKELHMYNKTEKLNNYCEATNTEEVYRLNIVYKQAFLDAVEMLKELKLL